jgi:hypothetical protein
VNALDQEFDSTGLCIYEYQIEIRPGQRQNDSGQARATSDVGNPSARRDQLGHYGAVQ